MAKVKYIITVLYEGLYDYVPNRKKKDYRNEFNNRNRYTSKFALDFFPRFIDFEKWSKNPKHEYDIILINYWLIEVPNIGLKSSQLFTSYIRGNKIINWRLKKKDYAKMKLTLNKKRAKPSLKKLK